MNSGPRTQRLRRSRLVAVACAFFALAPPGAALAVQYVGPPPQSFCCKDVGGATDGFAPRNVNVIYRQLGSGIAGLRYDRDAPNVWRTNTTQNPFEDQRYASYAQAFCADESLGERLFTVTCFAN
jgi:hypothetical protein